TKWTWVLVGVECDDYADLKRKSQDRPLGLVQNWPGVNVWVHTWSEVLSAAKRRYQFFLDKLEAELSADDALQHLRERHGRHLPESFAEPKATPKKEPSASNRPAPATRASGARRKKTGKEK